MQINVEQDYNLIVSKITEIKKDRAKMSPDLMLFVVENIHSEIFADVLIIARLCQWIMIIIILLRRFAGKKTVKN